MKSLDDYLASLSPEGRAVWEKILAAAPPLSTAQKHRLKVIFRAGKDTSKKDKPA